MITRTFRTIAVLSVCTISIAFILSPAMAQGNKGGGGGGSGGGGGGGGDSTPQAIYYHTPDWFDGMYTNTGEFWSMAPDGSNKTLLDAQPIQPTQSGSLHAYLEPSHNLRNGHRWFLTWPESDPIEYHPDGLTRQDIWAVRGDGDSGASVQLTGDPSLHYLAAYWRPDDSAIVFLGRRFNEDGTDIDEVGFYIAEVEWGADGNITGLVAQPTLALAVDPRVINTDPYFYPNTDWETTVIADVWDYSISPDGTQVVFASTNDGSGSRIRVGTFATGTAVTILTPSAGGYVSSSEWSPTGNTIAFISNQGIETMTPTGANRKVISKHPMMRHGSGQWVAVRYSPTGSHFAALLSYPYNNQGWWMYDIYLKSADGKGNTNLTSDLDTFAFLIRWR